MKSIEDFQKAIDQLRDEKQKEMDALEAQRDQLDAQIQAINREDTLLLDFWLYLDRVKKLEVV